MNKLELPLELFSWAFKPVITPVCLSMLNFVKFGKEKGHVGEKGEGQVESTG